MTYYEADASPRAGGHNMRPAAVRYADWGAQVPPRRRKGRGAVKLAAALIAYAIWLVLPAYGQSITVDGSCNIIVSGISGSNVTVYAPNCSASVLRPSPSFNKQDARQCTCASSQKFVRQLEAEINRLCEGQCERPSFGQSYSMLSQIARQLPACCHPDVMDRVVKSDASCKVKILARLWTVEDDLPEEALIARASARFRNTAAPEECYGN